jgi:hypothetical protein
LEDFRRSSTEFGGRISEPSRADGPATKRDMYKQLSTSRNGKRKSLLRRIQRRMAEIDQARKRQRFTKFKIKDQIRKVRGEESVGEMFV